MKFEPSLTELLAALFLRPIIPAAAALLLLRVFKVEHPASQHAVWTAVLAALLLVPIISIAGPQIDLPLLPAHEPSLPAPRAIRPGASGQLLELDPLLLLKRREEAKGGTPEVVRRDAPVHRSGSAGTVWRIPTVETSIVYGYFAGLLIMIVYQAAGWIMLRRIISRSRPSSIRPLRESADVIVPVATGLLRPVVIVPKDWRRWPVAKRRAVLAHEFTHIRRRDGWTAALGRVVKCVFWFHPLAWWTARKVSQLAELSCDARVVEQLGDPAGYSRILLEFAGLVNRVGHRVTLPGLAMVGSGLGKRIDHVFAVSAQDLKRLARPVTVLIFIGIPISIVSAAFGLTQTLSAPAPLAFHVSAEISEGPAAEPAEPTSAAAPTPVSAQVPAAAVRGMLDEFCVRCHSQALSAAAFRLDNADLNEAGRHPEIWEKVIRRLRARTHPPMGMPQPDKTRIESVIAFLEQALDGAQPAQFSGTASDNGAKFNIELASRLSQFLWNSTPDQRLLQLANAGTLSSPPNLEAEVVRMLADPKSKALLSNFFGELAMQPRLATLKPSARFPEFDEALKDAFRRETELFLESQVAENRSALDLLTANYTFVNERLARHYGIPNITGTDFQRVTLSDDRRAGILGHAGVLTLLSMNENGAPMRTSPNLRGKWIVSNILGVLPPDPPPSIPPLPDDPSIPVRKRMENHMSSARCLSCHVIMDPLGYALENFNAIGKWQDTDAGTMVDASGSLPDGTVFTGPAELRSALLDRREAYLNRMTEILLAYGLGRKPWARGVDYSEMPAVRAILREARSDNYRWSSLITAVAQSRIFQGR